MAQNFLNQIPSFIQGMQGMTLISDGADMAVEGANLQAAAFKTAGIEALQGGQFSAGVYRNAGKAAQAAASYNVALDQLQTARQGDALSRQITDLFAKNRVTQAASGFSFGSKSYLAVQASALGNITRQVNQTNASAKQRQDQITYEGLLSATTSENQARAAEYQGEAAKVNYDNQAKAAKYQGEVASYQASQAQGQNFGKMITGAFDSFLGH